MTKRVIVYAEDDAGVRQSTSWLLPDDEYNIQVCENGQLALEKIRELQAEGTPALLLTDYDMPVMNGIELIKALKAENIRIPTIMGTSTADIEEKIEAAGVKERIDLLLPKPMLRLEEAIKTVSAKYDTLQPRSHTDHAKKPSDDDMPPLP